MRLSEGKLFRLNPCRILVQEEAKVRGGSCVVEIVRASKPA